jgi:hypothetical protein
MAELLRFKVRKSKRLLVQADFNSDGMLTQQSPDSWTWEGNHNRKSLLIFAQGVYVH